jgi:TonB family protein
MRITKAYLTDGDEIEVGVTRFRVRLSQDLQKVAEAKAPSSRTQITREGFYRTEEKVSARAKLALEVAVLWEDSPIQVESFRRDLTPMRARAILLGLFAIGPLELWLAAAVATLIFNSTAAAIGLGAAGLGLAIYFFMDVDGWYQLGSRSLWMLRHGEGVYVGETHQCAFFLPSETVGDREYPLLVPHGSGWALNLDYDGIKGDVLFEGRVYTVSEAREQNLVKNNRLAMTPGTKCRLRFGQFSMLVSYVAVPARPQGNILAAIGVNEMVYTGVSLILHFGILILFVYMQPDDEIQIKRSKNSMFARFVNIESIKAKEKEEEEEPEKIEESKHKDDIDLDKRGEEEKLLEEKKFEKIKKRPDTKLTRLEQKQRNKNLAKSTSESMISTTLLTRLTGATMLDSPNNAGLKILGSAGADAPTDEFNAFAGSTSSPTGGGFAGLSEMGGTVGVGSAPNSRMLVAGLGKQGRKGKRLGNIRFKESKQRAIVTTGKVSVQGGALTRQIIKKYINRQKGSIILCYKRAVQKFPGLEGKVIITFMISPTGKVMRPGIRSSSLGNAGVEACIKQRLGYWRFPAPSNASAVRVTYPFLFRTR